ncbi:MAG: hypothetical protein AAF409_13470 [Pseudomonadota bacterium]
MTPRTDKEQFLMANGWEDMEAAEKALAQTTPDPRAEKSMKSMISISQLVCIVGLGSIFAMTLAGLT